MASKLSDADIIQYLSYAPRPPAGAPEVIRSNRPSFVPVRTSIPSSLGQLDTLPDELLVEIFDHLDLLALWHVSRVSLRGKAFVESLLKYQELVQYAGHVFKTFNRANVLSLHSLATLHAALHSGRCASCGSLGPLLQLVTAERCCLVCLEVYASQRIIPLDKAQKCFGLNDNEIAALPVMVHTRISAQVTLVGLAKAVALKKFGSMKSLATQLPLDTQPIDDGDENEDDSHEDSSDAEYEQEVFTWYREGPVSEPGKNPILMHHDPVETCTNAGVILFPSLRDGFIRSMFGCRCCHWDWNVYESDNWRDEAYIKELLEAGLDPDSFLWRMTKLSWSRSNFTLHIKEEHEEFALGETSPACVCNLPRRY